MSLISRVGDEEPSSFVDSVCHRMLTEDVHSNMPDEMTPRLEQQRSPIRHLRESVIMTKKVTLTGLRDFGFCFFF